MGTTAGRRRAWIALALVAAVGLGTAIRVGLAFSHPGFDRQLPEGMLKSDPGLLYYVTARIVEAGGVPPGDFRADPRIEHPSLTDIPSLFTVGQEFLVAWSYLAFDGRVPLHTLAVWVMAFVASLAAVGVFGLALELTGSLRFASFGLALFTLASASYRSVGFILVREDLSLPLFALHLWLLARLARVPSRPTAIACGLALAAALSTWHAMGFVVAVEAACLLAVSLLYARSPLALPHAWWVPACAAVAALVVPALRAKGALLSPAFQIAAALGLAAALEPRLSSPRARVASAVVALFAVAGLAAIAAAWLGTSGEYAHVWELMLAKLRYAGRPPDDPTAIAFGARLLWQGPFVTGSGEILLTQLPVAGVLLPVAALFCLRDRFASARNGSADVRFLAATLFAVAFALLAIAVWRTIAVAALVAPAVAAAALARSGLPSSRLWVAGLLAAQALSFASFTRTWADDWYYPPHQEELASLVGFVRARLPSDGAIAADYVTSTALLAHTTHPIVLQPKYESRASRERVAAFVRALYTVPLADFRAALEEEFDARYLVVDRQILWSWRYHAGLRRSTRALPAGTAAAAFLSPDPARYRSVEGFELLFERPRLRLYRIDGPRPDSSD